MPWDGVGPDNPLKSIPALQGLLLLLSLSGNAVGF